MAYPNLAAELKRYGISQEEVASRVNTTPETISRWMTGKSKMPVETCFRIKEEMFPHLSVDYLFSPEPIN